MKKLITIILLLVSVIVIAHNRQDTTWKALLDKLEFKLNDHEKTNYVNEIATLKDKLDFQQKVSEQSISCISNQLESASYNLTLFGLLFTIGVLFLGVYVTLIERKVVKIGEENKELLIKNQRIKEDVEAINELIKNDIYNLFLKIKREETVHILDRLVRVPQDIANVIQILLSRELEHGDFIKLRHAFWKLGKSNPDYNHSYLLLFFQHFLEQSLKDDQLRPEISVFIPHGIRSSFENDILKSTKDFVTVIVDKGLQDFNSEINLFFEGLTNSDFKDFNAIYKLLFDNLRSRKNRFELYGIVNSTEQTRHAKIKFGTLLQNKYAADNPTESELLAIIDLENLISGQE